MTSQGRIIGRIVRLQVQVDPLKRGERPRTWYDPEPIVSVPALRLDDGGVWGVQDDGTVLADVHHAEHPRSRYRGENGISIGFTGHYAAMRDHFGDHLTDGIAGENILVDAGDVYADTDFRGDVTIAAAGGEIELLAVEVAPPCVEFSRFALGYDRDRPTNRAVTEAVQTLHHGLRGFYARAAAPGAIRVGDLVTVRG